MAGRLFRFGTDWEPSPRPAPSGVAFLAIGDVHGHLAHLQALLRILEPAIAQARTEGHDPHLVAIGDYIDRGPAAVGVLEALAGIEQRLSLPVHRLRGNHDQYLIDFLFAPEPDPENYAVWLANGGDVTLADMGIGDDAQTGSDLGAVRAAVRGRLSGSVLGLLASLQTCWRCGDWLFVHAGIEPDRPIDRQSPARWLSIREPFLSGRSWSHDLTVVHGHTIRGPEVMPHRVGIDSGAYRTGVLTAVEIIGDRLRFHCITDREDLGRFLALPASAQARRYGPPIALP